MSEPTDTERLMRGEYVVWNGKLYARCEACGKLVRADKPLLGSLHFCVDSPEAQP